MDNQDFAIVIKARYPQLFESIKPISLSTGNDIAHHLSHDKDWSINPSETKRLLNRFLAQYQKTPLYILSECRAFLLNEARVGLNGESPILKGEILEVLTFAHRNGLEEYQRNPLYRYFEGCMRELEYEPTESA